MPDKKYFQKLKELDAEKLKEIRERSLKIRKVKSETLRCFKDLFKENLKIAIVLRDPVTNQIITDKKGQPILITKKEMLVENTINKLLKDGNIGEIMQLMQIVEEYTDRQETNLKLNLDDVRNKIFGEKEEKGQKTFTFNFNTEEQSPETQTEKETNINDINIIDKNEIYNNLFNNNNDK